MIPSPFITLHYLFKFTGTDIYCPELATVPLGTWKCDNTELTQQIWNIAGWNNGENCRAKCVEQAKIMGEGCCEARHRNNFKNTWCMYRKAVDINGGVSDSKAVLCKSNVYCSALTTVSLGSSKCDSTGVNQKIWNIDGWNDGENCQAKCAEQAKIMGEGCCEARHRNNKRATWCMFREASGINGGYPDSKAVVCKGM